MYRNEDAGPRCMNGGAAEKPFDGMLHDRKTAHSGFVEDGFCQSRHVLGSNLSYLYKWTFS